VSTAVLCMTVIVGQPYKAQMCNKRENLQHAVKQITTLHYIQVTILSRKTWVWQNQKGKPFWILMKQEMIGWQWHQLDYMQIICTSLQTDNHATICEPWHYCLRNCLPVIRVCRRTNFEFWPLLNVVTTQKFVKLLLWKFAAWIFWNLSSFTRCM